VEAWQVLGYLLADTDDRYAIRGCELAALRRRRTYTWEAQELVDALHGGPSQPVELWRGEFAQLLARGPAASRPVARRSPGPRPERSG
jgi:hypothetical protein